MQVVYTDQFLRDAKELPQELAVELEEKIEQFRDRKNHLRLRVHKLHGKMKKYYAFSVNYRYRVLFCYTKARVAVLMAVDTHDVYE